ncbi:hypothetical protein BD410DRAFT_780339 [Rickenella mellea]|uniref:Uncharacterized protein n=1 Tax=Rickenella mellea TaxID=50990 RepID=A0A4R5XFA8_9AGAM|nr:hypothetical protein BD410DRAFT_780339 [Rickenella mellea]
MSPKIVHRGWPFILDRAQCLLRSLFVAFKRSKLYTHFKGGFRVFPTWPDDWFNTNAQSNSSSTGTVTYGELRTYFGELHRMAMRVPHAECGGRGSNGDHSQSFSVSRLLAKFRIRVRSCNSHMPSVSFHSRRKTSVRRRFQFSAKGNSGVKKTCELWARESYNGSIKECEAIF